MASMETRLARAMANDAEAAWKHHRGMCARCSRVGKDRGAEPCTGGAGLRNEAKKLRTTARVEAALDLLPTPGSQTLF